MVDRALAVLLVVTEFCLLSTRKFVWVLLGPGLVTPGPKQIQPAAGFLLLLFFFQDRGNKTYPSIPKPMRISCPRFLLKSLCARNHWETRPHFLCVCFLVVSFGPGFDVSHDPHLVAISARSSPVLLSLNGSNGLIASAQSAGIEVTEE